MSASDFLSGKYPDGKAPELISLQPKDMTKLSEAPEGQLLQGLGRNRKGSISASPS